MLRTLVVLLTASTLFLTGAIDVNYGAVANNLPQPSRVVELIKNLPNANVRHVKLFNAPEDVLRAFSNSGLKMVVAVANDEVGNFAANNQAATNWVKQKISPFSQIIYMVVVGNERNDLDVVVSAMKNVKNALNAEGLTGISVTTPLAYGFLSKDYPPSEGTFKDLNSMRPLLEFLKTTNSVFMANIYPYFSWQGNKGQISLDYALFSDRVVVNDNGLNYKSLFDAMVDAVYSALDKAGYGNLKVVIGESGWPSAGEDGATVDNAKRYNSNLARQVNSNSGTPKRPNTPLEVYIFALFNENQKDGPEREKHWGLLYPDGTPVYTLS